MQTREHLKMAIFIYNPVTTCFIIFFAGKSLPASSPPAMPEVLLLVFSIVLFVGNVVNISICLQELEDLPLPLPLTQTQKIRKVLKADHKAGVVAKTRQETEDTIKGLLEMKGQGLIGISETEIREIMGE